MSVAFNVHVFSCTRHTHTHAQVEATFAAPHKPLVKSQHMDCGPLASKAHNRAAQQLETDTPESAPPNISKLALGVTRSAGVQKGLQQSEQQQSQIRQAQLQDRHTDAGIGRPSQKPSVFSKTWRDMPEWKVRAIEAGASLECNVHA
eukprot:scaffold243693_cov15-Tisochrysis_lutea.AAC.1